MKSNRLFITSCNASNSRGVAILFNKTSYTIHKKDIDESGNYVVLDLTVDDQRFTLASLYGPNTDDPNFLFTYF